MIAERSVNGKKSLIVAHPKGDRIMAIIMIVISFLLFYFSFPVQSSIDGKLIATWIFFTLPALVGASILRARIVVFHDHIEVRGVLQRKVEVPHSVSVRLRGPLVCLADCEGGFEFRFPKYLSHRGELEKRLTAFWDSRSEAGETK